MTTLIATWADGFGTLGLLAVAYGLACGIAEGGAWCVRQFYCGRRQCAWCKTWMGRKPGLPYGQVTHSICPDCLAQIGTQTTLAGGPRCSGRVEDGREPGMRAEGSARVTAGPRS